MSRTPITLHVFSVGITPRVFEGPVPYVYLVQVLTRREPFARPVKLASSAQMAANAASAILDTEPITIRLVVKFVARARLVQMEFASNVAAVPNQLQTVIVVNSARWQGQVTMVCVIYALLGSKAMPTRLSALHVRWVTFEI